MRRGATGDHFRPRKREWMDLAECYIKLLRAIRCNPFSVTFTSYVFRNRAASLRRCPSSHPPADGRTDGWCASPAGFSFSFLVSASLRTTLRRRRRRSRSLASFIARRLFSRSGGFFMHGDDRRLARSEKKKKTFFLSLLPFLVRRTTDRPKEDFFFIGDPLVPLRSSFGLLSFFRSFFLSFLPSKRTNERRRPTLVRIAADKHCLFASSLSSASRRSDHCRHCPE